MKKVFYKRFLPVILPHLSLITLIGAVVIVLFSTTEVRVLAIYVILTSLVATWLGICWFQYRVYIDRRVIIDLVNCLTMYSRGEYNFSFSEPRSHVLKQLISVLNRVHDKNDRTYNVLCSRLTRQQQILEEISQGVIVCDSESRNIIFCNAAASRLLNLTSEQAIGASLKEVCTVPDLLATVMQFETMHDSVEEEVRLEDERETVLHVRVKSVEGDIELDNPVSTKFLIELIDVTELKRLEKVRRDFVANVSHELKTPITSIQGSVETLLDGALKDEHDAERFVNMIGRHAQRLNFIFEDLLSLSRLEQGEGAMLERQEEQLLPVLTVCIELCEQRAIDKGVTLHLECSQDLTAYINVNLIQQALVNLIDNAVKYSSSGGSVRIKAEKADDETVHFKVFDNGPGIAATHLSRIFERFYRVDPARNRREGGTGLGLSIVKHIAQAHGGKVRAKSELGKGSCFEVIIPSFTLH
jgi:two-component system, OmpR family, phosphate regulon sensor histidine kinase PhoR